MTWIGALKNVFWLALIGGAAGYYVQQYVLLTSSYATVAAHTVILRAARDGTVQHAIEPFAVVQGNAELARVVALPQNDPELRETNAQLQTTRAEVASLTQLIAFGDEMRGRISNRQESLGARRAEHLQRLVEQADTERATRLASAEGAEVAKNRSNQLCSEGLMSAVDCETVTTRAEVSKRELKSAEGMLNISRFLLESTRAGRDVGQDLGSELTYTRQTNDDLKLRMASLRQQLETRQAQVRALEARANPPVLPLSVPHRSRVVRVHQPAGAVVVKGEPLLELADCDETFVYAIVSEAQYRKLSLGMVADVEIGSRRYSGRVVELLGPYAKARVGLAPDPPPVVEPAQALSGAVAIKVPELKTSLSATCPVGLAAKVRFSG